MATSTEPHICWRVVLADSTDYDPGEGVRHFSEERDAREHADDPPGSTAKPFPGPCVTVDCDECGANLESDAYLMHFDSVAQAQVVAEASDWTVAEDGRMYCDACPAIDEEDEESKPQFA